MSVEVDLGLEHFGRFFSWSPDRDINPQYDGIPDVERAGMIIEHRCADGVACSGAVTFDHPVMRRVSPESNFWTVHSMDPLTIEPSVLCKTCGDHGWIREGRWVPA